MIFLCVCVDIFLCMCGFFWMVYDCFYCVCVDIDLFIVCIVYDFLCVCVDIYIF